MEANALHAIEYDPRQCESYRAAIREIELELEHSTAVADVLILAGEAIGCTQNYNRNVEKFLHGHSSEMRSIIGLITQAFLKTSASGEIAASNLRQIEQKLAKASQLDDLRTIKSQIADAVRGICEEADRQERHVTEVKTQVEQIRIPQPPVRLESTGPYPTAPRENFEAPPGPPGRHAAEQYVHSKSSAGKRVYVLALCLERIDVINARFGSATRTQLLQLFGKDIARRLAERRQGDELFHWAGACFAAVLEREADIAAVRTDAFKIASGGLEHIVEVGARSVLLPLTARSALIPVLNASDAEGFPAKMDAFMTERPKQPVLATADRQLTPIL
ncbi:MAG: hypothetical protein ACR2I2_16160 [Bryobacteraceae bacterium]